MSKVVGIDLGTTNCCVAVMEGDEPLVISNKLGYKTTPSIVAITTKGTRMVGQIAARQAITNPEHTVHGAKRLIGRQYQSEEIQEAIGTSAFEIAEADDGGIRIVLQGEQYSVPELSAMLLQEMRVQAEEHLGERVDRAVVTVPAYFGDSQRQAVRDAGRIAGLDVLRILNEPTAAALSYGFGKSEATTLAVYDLGGGTFDISVVTINDEGEFQVVSTTGDSFLGGEDFDERLMAFLMHAFERDHGVDLREVPAALARLREAAQQAKTQLSSLEEVEIKLPFVAMGKSSEPLHMDYRVTREQLEHITSDLVQRTLQISQIGIEHANLTPEDIDEVVLVGGMTRMPAVQRAVEEFFGRRPCRGVHPDEVVALGAALHADMLAGNREVNLQDVTAHSLGIMTHGGRFDPLIPANTGVPVCMSSVFETSRDGQEIVKIVVLQGESPKAADNETLGCFAMSNLRAAPAGEVEVQVSFRIDEDGIFSVAARDLETGVESSIAVLASSGLSEEEIKAMMEDSAQYLAVRRAEEAMESNRQACDMMIAHIRQILPDAEKKLAWAPVGAAALRRAKEAVAMVERDSISAEPEALAHHVGLLERVETMLEKVLADDETNQPG